ncbi:MAG: STAS domain-containing protein [Candidatus Kerfeldbacteria bacterium]|nr:STAS domain-containing protein [Candidatus Kerfeldbacteria bacterium]
MQYEWHCLTVQAHDRILVVTLLGRYGIDTPDIFPTIRAEPSLCAENLQRFDALVIDLSRTEFINSEGISVAMLFIHRFTASRETPGRIGFVHGNNARHERLLNVLGLSKAFDAFGTLDEALHQYDQPHRPTTDA